ncbi:hypothetical protein BDZ91DRAFT_745345 [Kalaharituber pfeilii]|nr:hypothetical protein BDZ91DRAFT_745345 [Kalaharituber pfeilii]
MQYLLVPISVVERYVSFFSFLFFPSLLLLYIWLRFSSYIPLFGMVIYFFNCPPSFLLLSGRKRPFSLI